MDGSIRDQKAAAGRGVAAAAPRRRRIDPWASARLVVLACILVVLAFLAVTTLLAVAEGRFSDPSQAAAPAALGLAGLIYLGGHGLRILRLALLIGGWRVSLRDIASFHLFTAGASLAIPLKLGELYRVFELSYLAGGVTRALVITWWERVFDAVVLFALMFVAVVTIKEATPFQGLAALLGAFVVATAVVFFVAPDNLRRLSVLIIRRYDSPRTVALLRLIAVVRQSILDAPHLLRGKVPTVLTLTVLIWTADLICFLVAIPALRGSWEAGVTALLGFLSALTEGHTPLGSLADDAPSMVMVRLAGVQASLAFVGLAAGAYYAWRRWRARSA